MEYAARSCPRSLPQPYFAPGPIRPGRYCSGRNLPRALCPTSCPSEMVCELASLRRPSATRSSANEQLVSIALRAATSRVDGECGKQASQHAEGHDGYPVHGSRVVATGRTRSPLCVGASVVFDRGIATHSGRDRRDCCGQKKAAREQPDSTPDAASLCCCNLKPVSVSLRRSHAFLLRRSCSHSSLAGLSGRNDGVSSLALTAPASFGLLPAVWSICHQRPLPDPLR